MATGIAAAASLWSLPALGYAANAPAGGVAVLDPAARTLTALRPGTVTVSVTNGSMRAYAGDASLAPITTATTSKAVR